MWFKNVLYREETIILAHLVWFQTYTVFSAWLVFSGTAEVCKLDMANLQFTVVTEKDILTGHWLLLSPTFCVTLGQHWTYR